MKGMYTSNGNYSLRNSFPETDSGIAKKLRESGLVIMAKLGLSEYANSFGNQHSGFSNLTGQVLNGLDADAEPERLLVGDRRRHGGVDVDAGVGTETSGSIISPSQAQSLFGLRPTVGLVPGYGIGADLASQDTAGPMERTVENVALNLQATPGRDPLNESGYAAIFGPNIFDVIAQAPDPVPNYLSALDLELRQRQEDRLQRHVHARHAREDRVRRARRGGRDHGPAAGDRPSRTCRACRPATSSTRASTSTTSASARTRRSSRSSRRSPTTRPTSTRR